MLVVQGTCMDATLPGAQVDARHASGGRSDFSARGWLCAARPAPRLRPGLPVAEPGGAAGRPAAGCRMPRRLAARAYIMPCWTSDSVARIGEGGRGNEWTGPLPGAESLTSQNGPRVTRRRAHATPCIYHAHVKYCHNNGNNDIDNENSK